MSIDATLYRIITLISYPAIGYDFAMTDNSSYESYKYNLYLIDKVDFNYLQESRFIVKLSLQESRFIVKLHYHKYHKKKENVGCIIR